MGYRLTVGLVAQALSSRLRAAALAEPERAFRKVGIESRTVEREEIFFALKGEQHDGHDFIPQAVAAGATGVVGLAERLAAIALPSQVAAFGVDDTLAALQDLAAHWRRLHRVRVIGITGSVGKTTTKEMVAAVLGVRFKVMKNAGNMNNEVGLPLSLLELNQTHEYAVLEMGMYGLGEIKRLCEVTRPQMGVVTNVGHSHFERLGSLEAIAAAKVELVESLPADGTAVLNGDDPWVRPMAEKTQARVLFYGLDEGCALRASEVESRGLEGIRFRLESGGESLQVRAPLLGRHSVHIALAAAAVGRAEGLSWEEIVKGLQEMPAQLRLLVTPGIASSTIIDDTYNASPASVLAALNLLGELAGRRVAVLGDMLELGDYELEGHRLVARRAAEVAQVLVAVGSRGRIIGEEALRYGMKQVHLAADNEEAIAILQGILTQGDYVLIKGSRGAHMEQIVERVKAE